MTEKQNVIHFDLRNPQVWADAFAASQDRGCDRPAFEGQI